MNLSHLNGKENRWEKGGATLLKKITFKKINCQPENIINYNISFFKTLKVGKKNQ